MGKIIEAENVGYVYQSKYQKTKALTEVSCSFERGKVYAITGKSGSGKSTFLSLLAGLDVPTEGNLYIEGKEIRGVQISRGLVRQKNLSPGSHGTCDRHPLLLAAAYHVRHLPVERIGQPHFCEKFPRPLLCLLFRDML